MKTKFDFLKYILIALTIIAIVYKNTFKEKQLSEFVSSIIVTFVIIAIACYILLYAVSAVIGYVQELKTKKKSKVKEALSLLCYESFFPDDVSKKMDKYFSDEKTNIAIASFSINGKIIEYYLATSNTKLDKHFNNSTLQTKINSIPIIYCKDRYKDIDFIIRGAEGELIPLVSKDISHISKIESFSSAYYSCSERKIIGELLFLHKDEINASNSDTYNLTIFTKRPPCKYCNDLIQYYRELYGERLSFFVFDNLLLNLINNDDSSHSIFDNLDKAVYYVKEFENVRAEKADKRKKQEIDNQLLTNKLNEYETTINRYKRIIKILIIKIKHMNGFPTRKEEIKKICCISNQNKEGITEEEFENTWEKDN